MDAANLADVWLLFFYPGCRRHKLDSFSSTQGAYLEVTYKKAQGSLSAAAGRRTLGLGCAPVALRIAMRIRIHRPSLQVLLTSLTRHIRAVSE